MSIKVDHVFKYYGATKIVALHDVNLNIEQGMFGLLGPNGAGKTTLLRILATVLLPSSGSVMINNLDLLKHVDRRRLRGHIGYLPQEVDLYPDLTGEEFLDYFGLLKGVTNRKDRHTQVTSFLEALHLEHAAHQKIKTYSGGMKRRLGIGQTMMGNPRVIIVDEPTAGLDPEERIRIRQMLTNLAHNKTIILSTHFVEDINQTCEQVAVLDQGRIIFQGRTRDLIALAQGYTWELSGIDGQTFPLALQVVAQVPDGENILYRLVGEPSQHLRNQGQMVTPTLEDAYVRLRQLRSKQSDAPRTVGVRQLDTPGG